MIFLDTNVAIMVMNKSSPYVVHRFQVATARETLLLSSVALHELHFGITNSARPVENGHKLDILLRMPVRVLPFEAADAREAGAIRADLRRKGTPIGSYDVLIAAQARRHGAILVTNNTREFVRVEGLALEDWAEQPT